MQPTERQDVVRLATPRRADSTRSRGCPGRGPLRNGHRHDGLRPAGRDRGSARRGRRSGGNRRHRRCRRVRAGPTTRHLRGDVHVARLSGRPCATRVEVDAGATVTLDVELAVELEERVVVVGSRAQPRSVTESQVPIDAIPFQDVVSQGMTTLDYQLRTLVPSFNVATHPISDAATLVRPASIRNLAHDHTLVLVNGKAAPPLVGHRLVRRGGPTARRDRTSRPSPPSPCGRSRCCATAPRHSTARTR